MEADPQRNQLASAEENEQQQLEKKTVLRVCGELEETIGTNTQIPA